jgi:hypothetical protein
MSGDVRPEVRRWGPPAGMFVTADTTIDLLEAVSNTVPEIDMSYTDEVSQDVYRVRWDDGIGILRRFEALTNQGMTSAILAANKRRAEGVKQLADALHFRGVGVIPRPRRRVARTADRRVVPRGDGRGAGTPQGRSTEARSSTLPVPRPPLPPGKENKLLARVHGAVLDGVVAREVVIEIEVDRRWAAPRWTGWVQRAARECLVRVQAALRRCGFDVPPHCILMGAVPGDPPVRSAALDLPVAIGLLVATGRLSPEIVDGTWFAGELTLARSVLPEPGGPTKSR